MHTLLNDKNPMNSTLIFSQGKDSIEDNYLKPMKFTEYLLRQKWLFSVLATQGQDYCTQ